MSREEKHSFIKVALLLKQPFVLITNHETFASQAKDGGPEPFFQEILDAGNQFGCIIVDESTRIKSTSAKRTKGILKLRKLSKRRYIFTGFPSPQSPADYVGQCAFLHPLYLGYSSTNQFEMDNATRGYGNKVDGWAPGAIRSLQNSLREFATSIQTSDTDIVLPERVYKTINVQISGEQAQIYDRLAAEYYAFVKGELGNYIESIRPCEECEAGMVEVDSDQGLFKECEFCKGSGSIVKVRENLTGQQRADMQVRIQSALVKAMKLSQITGGWAIGFKKCHFCYGSGLNQSTLEECDKCHGTGELKEHRQLAKNAKMEALEELLEDQIQKPFIICSAFRHELQFMSQKFGLPIIWGGTKASEVERIIDDVTAGRIPGVLMQPDSGGIGINGLQVCKTVIYYTNSFKLESRVQSEKRAHRIGQTSTVTIVDLVADYTVDERIAQRLQEKKDVAMEILEFPHLVKREGH